MNILVTNDDGIDSPGIYALVQSLSNIGEVIVIAPDRQQSAVGHALTVSSPLRVTPFHRNGKMFGFAVNGTPSDCVKLGISTLLDIKPDIVVSGINHGSNTSVNVLYSGTVSAATEGVILGIPSIAVSHTSFSYDADCGPAAEYAMRIALQIRQLKLPSGTLLNVNVPDLPGDQIKGVVTTGLGSGYWNDVYEKRQDPMGRDYYWLRGEYITPDDETGSDDDALARGYVSVSPIRYQLTDRDSLAALARIQW